MDKDYFYILKGAFIYFNFKGEFDVTTADEYNFPDAIVIPRNCLANINGGIYSIGKDEKPNDELEEFAKSSSLKIEYISLYISDLSTKTKSKFLETISSFDFYSIKIWMPDYGTD